MSRKSFVVSVRTAVVCTLYSIAYINGCRYKSFEYLVLPEFRVKFQLIPFPIRFSCARCRLPDDFGSLFAKISGGWRGWPVCNHFFPPENVSASTENSDSFARKRLTPDTDLNRNNCVVTRSVYVYCTRKSSSSFVTGRGAVHVPKKFKYPTTGRTLFTLYTVCAKQYILRISRRGTISVFELKKWF